MTLLESVVAFVLLAVVGIACLDLSRGATGLETRSVEWTRAVAIGDAVIAAAAAGAADDATLQGEPPGREVRVQRTPWRDGADGIEVLDVRVSLPTGESYRATRLVRSPRVQSTRFGALP